MGNILEREHPVPEWIEQFRHAQDGLEITGGNPCLPLEFLVDACRSRFYGNGSRRILDLVTLQGDFQGKHKIINQRVLRYPCLI